MGSQLAFGQFLNPVYKFDQADVVLSIDSNFLGNGPGGVRYARDFVSKRVVRGGGTTQNRSMRLKPRQPLPAPRPTTGRRSNLPKWSRFVRSLAAALAGGAAPGRSNSKFYSRTLVKDLQGGEGQVDRDRRRRSVA